MSAFAALTSAFGQEFMRNALLAGTAVAIASGLVGYFLVLRGQVFTADVLGHVAFTGATAALALGLDPRAGLFVATIGIGGVLGGLGRRGRADDVVIGNVLAWVLGLGVFFLAIYVTSRSAGNGTAGVSVLFGSVLGLDTGQAMTAAGIAFAVAAAVLVIARPLLFATVDEPIARSLGVPVRFLGITFLALAGIAAAEATQVVGSLLLLGLLAAPAGTALRLTARPFAGLALSCAIAVADVWIGLALSALVPALPPSFSVLAAATAGYAVAIAWSSVRARARA